MDRRGRACCAWLAGLLLAGCAHLPQGGGVPDRPGALDEVAQSDLPPGDAAAEPDGDGSLDLFAHLRSGFALPAPEHASVARELEQYRGHPASLARTLRRGERYLHHIAATLEARDMPLELALLPAVESAFDPFAHSARQASGLWQFVPGTGRRYGLDQDWWCDQRRGVVDATRAALDHLQDLHEEFAGDWLLALAAYNAGARNVKRAVERSRQSGRPTDFFHLDLPPETRRYVPKLLALSRLVADPEAFGVELPAISNAPYFVRVDLESQIDLDRAADLAQIPRAELRALNPEFNRWVTAPDGPHQLLVPARARDRFESALACLPLSNRLRFVRHRVRRGDTLYAIARRHESSVDALRALNRLRGSLIHPGQELLVPVPYRATDALGRTGNDRAVQGLDLPRRSGSRRPAVAARSLLWRFLDV